MDDTYQKELRLLCRLSEESTLQEVTDIAFELLGNPVFIADAAQNILAHSKVGTELDEAWESNIVKGELDRLSWAQLREINALHSRSAQSRFPILVRDEARPQPRAIRSITNQTGLVGAVVMPEFFKPISETDLFLLELISKLVKQKLCFAWRSADGPEAGLTHFLTRLLDGPAMSREQVKNHLARIAYTPALYVMLLRPGGEAALRPDQLLSRAVGLLHCVGMQYHDEIVLLYGRKEMASSWPQDEPRLCRLLASWSVSVGISGCFSDLSQLRQYYQDAAAALRLGAQLRPGERIHPYNEFLSYHMLERLSGVAQLRKFCHEKILLLEDYEKTRGGDLLTTLQVYLESAKNLSRTAKVMNVHPKTVRYRIDRCMELARSDLEDGNEIYSFITSLRIIAYLRSRQAPAELPGTGE